MELHYNTFQYNTIQNSTVQQCRVQYHTIQNNKKIQNILCNCKTLTQSRGLQSKKEGTMGSLTLIVK